MKTGLVSITFRQLSVEEILKVAVETGLQGIEWGGDVHVPHGNIETARLTAKLTTQAGLQVASYGSYYSFDPEGPSMEDVVATAEALEAPAIRVWAGQKSPGSMPEQERQRIVQDSRRLADMCHQRGMRLDFEFHEDTLTETPESTCQLLADIQHPAVHSLWQPPLCTPLEKRLRGLIAIRNHVSNIHCNHFGQDPWPKIHPLQSGSDEWRLFLKELESLGGERWILLEHVMDHSIDQFRLDAETLLSWVSRSVVNS